MMGRYASEMTKEKGDPSTSGMERNRNNVTIYIG
jgi:hypothetical protein